MNDQYLIVFCSALFFLGILITWGNERQRKAIDGVRKATIQWANRDIHIKRGQVSREIHIHDVGLWLNQVILQVHGNSPEILHYEFWDQAGVEALIGFANGGNKYILSACDLDQIRHLEEKDAKGSRIRAMQGSLLGSGRLSTKITTEELTVVNAGIFFDLEVEKIWEVNFHKKIVAQKMFLFEVKGQNV